MHYRIMQDIAQPMSAVCSQANWGSEFNPIFDENIAPNAYGIYSLRRIASQKGPVVRLRRASDSEEKDFKASELTNSSEGSELITNGDFATDSDWAKGTDWTISGGQASCNNTSGSNSKLSQSISEFTAGGYFKMEFTIVAFSSNTGSGLRASATTERGWTNYGITTTGTYTVILNASIRQLADFQFWCGDGETLTIDDVSVKPYTPTVAELWVLENLTSGTEPWSDQVTNSAYVTTWYDQSGSLIAEDMTQTNINFQPRLITAGLTEKNPDTGIPAIRFNHEGASTATFLYFNQTTYNEAHLFAVYNSDDTDGDYLYPHSVGYGPVANFGNSNSTLTSGLTFDRNASSYNSTSFNDREIISRSDYGRNIDRGKTGLSYYKMDMTPENWNVNTKLGAYANGINNYNCNGWFSEVALIKGYDSLSGLDVAKINVGISDYYKIPTASLPLAAEGNTEPSAAFSLRSITGDASKNVVRLRKSGNGEERDFRASEISDRTVGDELVPNGVFDRNGLDWTILSTTGGISFSGGKASWDGTATGYAGISSDFSFERKQYIVEFDATCSNFMQFYLQWGNHSTRMIDLGVTSNGSKKIYLDMREYDYEPGNLRFYSNGVNVTATIDNVSVKELTPSTAELWVMENSLSVTLGVKYGRINSPVTQATVVTLYNQANEGSNDATQPIVNSQPLLIDGALLLTNGVRPAMLFDNVDDCLPFGNPGFSGDNPHSVYAAVNALSESSSGGAYFGCMGGSRLDSGSVLDLCPENVFYIRVSGNSFYGSGTDDNSGRKLFSVLFNSGDTNVFDYKVFRQGSEVPQVSGSSNPAMNLNPNGVWALGASEEQTDIRFNGYIQEVIVYNDKHNPKDRTIIEANMNGYYGIYLDDPWYDLNSWNDDLVWS